MSESARRTFDAQDVLVAFTVALLAQLGLVAAFSLPSPKLVEADISDDNARPIAVAITPVLRLGTKSPTKLPTRWQRKQPLAAKSQGPTPSPQAEKTLEAIPKTNPADASVGPVVADAGKPELPLPTASEPTEGGSLAATSPIEGSEQGAANGTEVSPLKAIAEDAPFHRHGDGDCRAHTRELRDRQAEWRHHVRRRSRKHALAHPIRGGRTARTATDVPRLARQEFPGELSVHD